MGTYNATSSGSPTYVTGRFGNALNPSGGRLTLPASITNATGTFEAWVNTTSTSGISVAFGCNTTGAQQWFGVSSGVAAGSIGATSLTSSINIADGAWHHLAITLTGTTATLWVDGGSGASGSTTSGLNLISATAIGAYGNSGSFLWPGQVDEVRISSTARYTGSFTRPSSAFADDGNTIALFHLEADGTDSHGASGDTTAPTVPGTPAATAGNASATITFSASTDNVGVAGYRVYSSVDSYASSVATGSASPITVTGLTNGTAYTFKVAAYDAAGNTSAQSTISNSVTPTSGSTSILPNDTGIAYSPFNWNVGSSKASTINAGAYFSASISNATAIALNFDVTSNSTPLPRIKARVDDGPWAIYTLAASIALTMPTTNTWGSHIIEVVVLSTDLFGNRWVGTQVNVNFTGLTCTGSSVATRAVPISGRPNVLFYGDSITEAYKSLENLSTPDGSDASVGWAYLQKQYLGIEAGIVGFGGQGWLVGGTGSVPALPSSYNLLYTGVSRSFTTTVPDLIVINMGENDGANDVTAAATSFLNTLLALNSTTKIALMRPFSGKAAAFLQAAATACNAPSRVTYVDTTGWFNSTDSGDGQHPYGIASASSLAPRLASALRPILTPAVAPKRYLNVGGTAKPIQ